jgi:hypothetical protein
MNACKALYVGFYFNILPVKRDMEIAIGTFIERAAKLAVSGASDAVD